MQKRSERNEISTGIKVLLLCQLASGWTDHRLHLPNPIDFTRSCRRQKWHIHMLYVYIFIDFVLLVQSMVAQEKKRFRFLSIKFQAFFFRWKSVPILFASLRKSQFCRFHSENYEIIYWTFPVIGVAVYSTWLYGIYRVSSIDLSVNFNAMFAFLQHTPGKYWRAIVSIWMIHMCVLVCLSVTVCVRLILLLFCIGCHWQPAMTFVTYNVSVFTFFTLINFWITFFSD